MGMSIDESIKKLSQSVVVIGCENWMEARDLALETMRKYQQLQADYENRLKKGKWIAHRKSNGEVGYFQCTSCDHHSVVKFPYCPICGAEMDCNPNILSEMKAIPRDMYENRLKADMAAMLTDIQLDVEGQKFDVHMDKVVWNDAIRVCSELIQQRINELKAGQEWKE